jgi:hypothetical protein
VLTTAWVSENTPSTLMGEWALADAQDHERWHHSLDEERQRWEDGAVSSWGLIRLAGVSAALGGVLLLATDVFGWFVVPLQQSSALTPPEARGFWPVVFLLALVLTLGGLVGLYARQAVSAGVLGLVGFAAAFSGMALSVGIAWLPFPAPSLALAASGIGAVATWVGLVLAFAGWALFGVASMRAGVFPGMAAMVLLVGAVLSFLTFVGLPGTLVLDVAIVWMGLALLSGRAAPAVRPARAR